MIKIPFDMFFKNKLSALIIRLQSGKIEQTRYSLTKCKSPCHKTMYENIRR